MIRSQADYIKVLDDLKSKIKQARMKASLAVNAQLISLYWEVGNTILQQQKTEGWGTKVIKRLAADLKAEFSDMKGLSERNLVYMQTFASAYPDFPFTQAALAELQSSENEHDKITQGILAQLPWYHHITLLDKVKDPATRVFYIQEAIQNGWSRDIMVHQIEGGLHLRKGKISNNFENTIAPEQSELVQQIFKDPYKFEFIYLGTEAKERDLENALVNQLTKFLLELGQHFAFMGRQYKVNVGEKEYFYDLLFYHTRLKRYIVIELKIDEFKPEYKGKMEFYLNIADDHLKQADDEKSIGLILCKTKDGLVVEYALRDSTKPIGIAEYKINQLLPDNIRGEIPSIEELETQMEEEIEKFQKPIDKKRNKIKELIKNFKQEEVKEKWSPEVMLPLLEKIVIPLHKKVLDELSNEIPMFENVEFLFGTQHMIFKSSAELEDHLVKVRQNSRDLHYELRLNGFKPAGTNAFRVYQQLYIVMDDYKYSIGFERNEMNSLIDKLYHQLPEDSELTFIVEKFCESVLESIEHNIERIKSKK